MLFQTLLLSDGVTSFCILVYIEAAATLLVGDRVIGFSAGDGRRFITLLNRNEDDADFNPIADVNMFRIDGKCSIYSGYYKLVLIGKANAHNQSGHDRQYSLT